VELMGETYCIDMDRVFVVGHSLGAWMSNTVACVRGDAVRASATVGGDMAFTHCHGPAAALIAHNPNDNLAAFWGSERVRDLRIEENFCAADTQPVASTDLNCIRYDECTEGNPILFCPHNENNNWKGDYYPHVWPDSMAEETIRFFGGLR
jgi:polyhydroxybutyrate depolymerase